MPEQTRVLTCAYQDCIADGVVQSTAFRLCAMHAAADLRRFRTLLSECGDERSRLRREVARWRTDAAFGSRLADRENEEIPDTGDAASNTERGFS